MGVGWRWGEGHIRMHLTLQLQGSSFKLKAEGGQGLKK